MKRASAFGGFTMIEIMIVVAIMGIMLAVGVPSAMRVFQKDPLRQTEANILEACSRARAHAILQNQPTDVVITGDGSISVHAVTMRQLGAERRSFEAQVEGGAGPNDGASPDFQRQIHPDVAVELFYVNLTDQMEAVQTRVRFYPNGMSDEMTIVLNYLLEERRMITLDPITGLADLEVFQ